MAAHKLASLADVLHSDSIVPNMKAGNKQDAIRQIAKILSKSQNVLDDQAIFNAVWEREQIATTAIGHGVALPHGKTNAVKHLSIAFASFSEGINFDSIDGEPVYLVFLMVSPPDESGPHIQALARISRLLKRDEFRQALREASSHDEILSLISKEETEHCVYHPNQI